MALWPCLVFADDHTPLRNAAELRAAILAGGHHETDEQRNSVSINSCTMTTQRWKNIKDEGWVLYSSFRFDMWSATLSFAREEGAPKYMYAGADSEPDPKGVALVGFKMRAGSEARFEKSVLRKPKGETRPSPRGDGTTHYYEQITNFFFSMQGIGVEDKARLFTESYDVYVREFCTPIG